MSNLLQTDEGRAALYEARNYLLRRRLSRFFKRNLVIDYSRYSHGLQEFDLETLLGDLNPANDDEILDLYRLLGTFGGLETSIGDVNIYVDADNGDDQTGTGSANRPMASLWFVPYLPKKINHFYRIILMSDIDMSGVNGQYLDFDQNIGINGCLTLAGYGPEEEVLNGLAGVSTFSTPFMSEEYIGVNPAPTAATIGNWVQNTTAGGRLGEVKPICYYTGILNGELLTWGYPTIFSGDTLRYIRPARVLKVKGVNLRLNCAVDDQNPGPKIGSRFGILNLRIECDPGATATAGSFYVNCQGHIFLSFVHITPDVTAASYLQEGEWRSGNVNTLNLTDITVYDEIGLDGVPNLKNRAGLYDCAAVIFYVADLSDTVLTFRGSYGNIIRSVVALGRTRTFQGSAVYDRIGTHNGFYLSQTKAELYNSCVACPGGNGLDLFDSVLRTQEVAIQQATTAVSLANSRLVTYGIGVDATYGRSGGLPAYHGQLSQGSIWIMILAWSGMASGTADLRLIDSNPDVTGAFPGAGAQLTDGRQSAVVRPG